MVAIRSDPALARVRVVVMTGDLEGPVESMAAGAAGALRKRSTVEILTQAAAHAVRA